MRYKMRLTGLQRASNWTELEQYLVGAVVEVKGALT